MPRQCALAAWEMRYRQDDWRKLVTVVAKCIRGQSLDPGVQRVSEGSGSAAFLLVGSVQWRLACRVRDPIEELASAKKQEATCA